MNTYAAVVAAARCTTSACCVYYFLFFNTTRLQTRGAEMKTLSDPVRISSSVVKLHRGRRRTSPDPDPNEFKNKNQSRVFDFLSMNCSLMSL